MTDARPPRRFGLAPWPILLLVFVFAFGAAVTLWGPVNLLAWRGGPFPETDPERPLYQQGIVEIARAQYEEQPGGARYFTRGDGEAGPSESTVAPKTGPDRRYPEGRWDAAFVSWVLNEVGLPVRAEQPGRPNSWLVTDVLELAGAMADRGAYIDAAAEPEFSPQIGDLVFYDYPGPFGHHVNMVVAVHGEVVTVGGDEFGKVGLASMNLRNRSGIMGWGATGMLEGPLAADPLPAPEIDVIPLPDDADPDPEFGPRPAPMPEDAPR
ncbi:CHAP domain-containing protein [Corynebacterium hansenii]|uniref:CHAP domain-containing protein n=1 Tax=Corynebacterium hansenii TaxID=394964 RepID=A0ABV7ZQE4_9CORY|nr:CHAP domain-containing protein [Corynebacterium hansenii]WJZ00945.1 hypothetical protein CHAN_11795 [Corynebacterium hansenii]